MMQKIVRKTFICLLLVVFTLGVFYDNGIAKKKKYVKSKHKYSQKSNKKTKKINKKVSREFCEKLHDDINQLSSEADKILLFYNDEELKKNGLEAKRKKMLDKMRRESSTYFSECRDYIDY